MANNFFQFKQFKIFQDNCAMKVCTDACLTGAWVADKIRENPQYKRVLDVGCGTGLLSLMVAQTSAASIDAIEIDQAAAKQARENVLQSPWRERIHIQNISLQEFTPHEKYDLIISNPPFFQDSLKSADAKKNAAKHETSLTLEVLVPFIRRNLNTEGLAVVLLPYHRSEEVAFIIRENGLFIAETLFVKQSPSHPYFRSIILFSALSHQPIESNEITIHDAERNYTKAFQELLQPYYLNL